MSDKYIRAGQDNTWSRQTDRQTDRQTGY